MYYERKEQAEKDEGCMMKQTRTYIYKKVNIKDGKVKLTASDTFDDDVFILFCVWRISSTNG